LEIAKALALIHDMRCAEWTELRDRWEYSHVLRAGFGLAGLILIVAAVAG
jgi:hypothetical protein